MKGDYRCVRFWSATLDRVFDFPLQGFPDVKLEQFFLFPRMKIEKAFWVSLHIQL